MIHPALRIVSCTKPSSACATEDSVTPVRAANASTVTRMAESIFMDRISGDLANRMSVGRAFRRGLSRHYRILTDPCEGQKVFRLLRTGRPPASPAVDPTY